METLKRYRLWAIVVSCCMIVLGAAMILRPDISALAVCYLTGALCIAMGMSVKETDRALLLANQPKLSPKIQKDAALIICINHKYRSVYKVNEFLMDATLSSGRTTQGAIYYEVPENAQTIELEYDINYFSSNKIIFMGK